MNILVIDVGGTHVKILATGQDTPRKFDSGPTMTPGQMVAGVVQAAEGWTYDVVSIGYPGPVLRGKPVSEPHNLGPGWVGFDFEAALGHPVKVVNDSAMQAIGSDEGGRCSSSAWGPVSGPRWSWTASSRRWNSDTSRTGSGRTRTTWGNGA